MNSVVFGSASKRRIRSLPVMKSKPSVVKHASAMRTKISSGRGLVLREFDNDAVRSDDVRITEARWLAYGLAQGANP